MLTDPDKQAAGNREPTCEKFSDEMYKEDPTQDIPGWLQPVTVHLEDLEKCARRFLGKSEHRLGRWRFKKWRHKKRKHSIHAYFRKYREPSLKPKVIHMDDCEELSWNHRTAISHRLETWNFRTSCTSSKRRDISVLLQSGLNGEWWSDSMKCFYYLQNVQNLLANGKSQIWTKIWGIVQRTNCTIWRTGWISPRTPRKIKQEFINLERKLSHEFFIGYALFPCENLGRRYSNYWGWRIWKFGVIEIFFRKLNAKEVLRTQRDEEFVFLAADGSPKISGRNYKFQEPTLRRESVVRRENISGESQGDREEVSTWRIKKMTKESTRFSWLTQKLGKNFTYRHHIEPRSSIARAKKKTYPIRLDFFWCHQVNLCRSRSCTRKANLWLLGCRREHKFVNIVNEFHKIYVIEWNSSEKVWRTWRRHHVQITYGLTHWQEFGKQLKEEGNKNKRKEKRLFHAKDRILEHAYGKPMFQINKSRSVWRNSHLYWYCSRKTEFCVVLQLGTRIRSNEKIWRHLCT